MSSGRNSTAALRRFLRSLLWSACEPNTLERTHAVFSLQPCSIVAALQCIVQTNAGAQRRHLHLNSTLHISLFTLERSDFAGAPVAVFEQVLAENERKLSRKLRVLVLYTVKRT